MNTLTRRTLLIASSAALLSSARLAFAGELPDYTDFDLESAGIKTVAPTKDPKTGFVVGGKNETKLIRQLTEINGRTIAELEADMRPGAKTEVGSDAGFLGKDERLLEVLASDNKLVVDDFNLTHQQIARHLHALGAIASHLEAKGKPPEFRYHGRRYRVALQHSRGYQLSPFRDGTKHSSNATVTNLDTKASVSYALLVPFMIERYGFYEGQGTEYRVEPQAVVKVLDFLREQK